MATCKHCSAPIWISAAGDWLDATEGDGCDPGVHEPELLVPCTTSPNATRASEAMAALEAYRVESLDRDLGDYENIHAFVALLAAMRHLCDEQGWNFGYLDKQAYGCYAEDIDAHGLA